MNIKSNKNILRCLELFCLFLIGLIPLLWFRDGFLINGADIDFPLRPIQEFLSRCQTWDSVYQGGHNNVLNLATLVFFGVQALFYLITHSLVWAEKLSFVFWFQFSLFSCFYLVNSVILKEKRFLVRLLPCLFYQFNFYQLVCWAEVHIAGITALAVMPAMFALLMKFLKNKLTGKNLILFSALVVFSSGIWVNPPTAIVFIIVFISYSLFYFIPYIRSRDWSVVKTIITKLVLLAFLYVILNAYVLVPFVDTFMLGSGGVGAGDPVADFNVLGSLQFQSEHSSPLNVLRLMGRSDLYFTWKDIEYYYPFFLKYMHNRWLIAGSYLLPVLAFLGFILRRKDRFTRYFCGLAVIGIILGVGIYSPMTGIYKWLVHHLPLFYLFRQPWLKFALWTAFAYPILAGLCCSSLVDFLERLLLRYKKLRQMAITILLGGIIVGYMVFMHSFVLGEMFTPQQQRKVLNSMHLRIPDYIFQASKWFNNQSGDFAIGPLPTEKSNVYRWGYRGITDVFAQLVDKTVLYEPWGEMGESEGMPRLFSLFGKELYQRLSDHAEYLLNFLGVRYLLERKDIDYSFYGDKESPEFIRACLTEQEGIDFLKSYGLWDIYENRSWQDDFLFPADKLIWIDGNHTCMWPLAELVYGQKIIGQGTVFALREGGTLEGRLREFCERKAFKLLVYCKNNDFLRLTEGWQGDTGFLFYPQEDNEILKSLKKKVWINKEGKYKFSAQLKINYQNLLLSQGTPVLFTAEDILDWDYTPHNVSYRSKLTDDILAVDVSFDGSSSEDEYVRLRKEGMNIDINKYPFFIMDYKVVHPRIQTIEIMLGLDFDDDGQADEHLRGFRTIYPLAVYSQFKINIAEKIKYRFPTQKTCKVVLVEVYPHKLWRVDCSRGHHEGDYGFYIKNIKFTQMKEERVLETYDDKSLLGTNSIKYEVKEQKQGFMKYFVPLPPVDISQYTELELKYRFRPVGGVAAANLYIQLESTEGQGTPEVLFLGKMPVVHKYGTYRINLGDFYSNKKYFNGRKLTGLELVFVGRRMKEDIGDLFRMVQIRAFNSSFLAEGEQFDLPPDLIKIDRNVVSIPDINKQHSLSGIILVTETVSLDVGWTTLELNFKDDDALQCQWAVLLPQADESIVKQPLVQYTRVNPTAYRIDVKEVTEPFVLVMKNNYDNKWKAYIKKYQGARGDGRGQGYVDDHFRINGFANAWLIPDLDSEMEIELRYYPQDLFRIGLWISGLGLVGLLIVLIIGMKIKRK